MTIQYTENETEITKNAKVMYIFSDPSLFFFLITTYNTAMNVYDNTIPWFIV